MRSKLEKLEYSKKYYQKNSIRIKEHYQKIREKKLKNQKEYYQNHKEERIQYHKEYYQTHKEEIIKKTNDYMNKKIKTDINYKLTRILRHRLHGAVRGNFKSGSAVKDLGCSIPELKTYLESKFQTGMNWNNYGYRGWHIDHILPLTSFDLTNREELLKACHYTNLQPMWGKENIRKGSKYE